jgi:acetyl esterase/lipase
MNTPSYQQNANAKPLNRAMMGWFAHYTIRTAADLQDPRINLVAADLRGLPPATVVLAEIDPLRSEGMTLIDRLRASDVKVAAREFQGATHEFFGMDAVVADARDAQRFAAEQLSLAFAGR